MRPANLIASIRNEVSCINLADAAWLIEDGGRFPIVEAFECEGKLFLRMEESYHDPLEVPPSNVLPGGRGIWEQIEIESTRKESS